MIITGIKWSHIIITLLWLFGDKEISLLWLFVPEEICWIRIIYYFIFQDKEEDLTSERITKSDT